MPIRRILSVFLVLCLVSSLTGQGGTVPVSGSSASEAVSCLAPFASAADMLSSPENVMRRIVEDMRANAKSNPSVAPETVMERVLKAEEKISWVERARSLSRMLLKNSKSDIVYLVIIAVFSAVMGAKLVVLSDWMMSIAIGAVAITIAALAMGRRYFTSRKFQEQIELFFTNKSSWDDFKWKTFVLMSLAVLTLAFVFSMIIPGTAVPLLISVMGYIGLFSAISLTLGKIQFSVLKVIHEAYDRGYTFIRLEAASLYGIRKKELLADLESSRNAFSLGFTRPSYPVNPQDGVPGDDDIEGYIRRIMSENNPTRLRALLEKIGPGVDRYIDAVVAQEPLDRRDSYHVKILNFCVLISYWHNLPESFENDPKIFMKLCDYVLGLASVKTGDGGKTDFLTGADNARSTLQYGSVLLEAYKKTTNNEMLFHAISHEIGHVLHPYYGSAVAKSDESVMEIYAMLSEMTFAQLHGINPDLMFYNTYARNLLSVDKFADEYGLDAYKILDGFLNNNMPSNIVNMPDLRQMMQIFAQDAHTKAILAVFYLMKLGYDPYSLLTAFRTVEKEYETTTVDFDFTKNILLLDAA